MSSNNFATEKWYTIYEIIGDSLNHLYKSYFCIEFSDCCKCSGKKIPDKLLDELTLSVIETFHFQTFVTPNIINTADNDDYSPYIGEIKKSLLSCSNKLVNTVMKMFDDLVDKGIIYRP